MKQLTSSEKFDLIRFHGASLANTARGVSMTRKSDVIESARRIIELANAIPKIEWGIEEWPSALMGRHCDGDRRQKCNGTLGWMTTIAPIESGDGIGSETFSTKKLNW